MRLLAFDTPYVYYRSFFGVPSSVTAPDGIPVNAIRGTLDALARLVDQYSPTHVAMAWDADWRPAWRTSLVPSYKAHRVVEQTSPGASAEETPDELAPQVPVVHEVLTALGLAPVGVADHEADDVLGSLAESFDGEVLVVTGDRDLFQLVGPTTSVVYLGRGISKHQLVDEAHVQQTYGIPADRYSDFAVLRGDPSDGLPGVKGIGEKTAATLVSRFENLGSMVEAAGSGAPGLSPAQRRALSEQADYVQRAAQVVNVVRDLEVSSPVALPVTGDGEALDALGERWGLGSVLSRARAALASA